MNRTLLIKVSQSHIDRGITSSRQCPIALAIKDFAKKNPKTIFIFISNPKYKPTKITGGDISVGGSSVILYERTAQKYQHFELSTRAKKFIERFDKGKSVKPQNFKLTFVKYEK